MNPIVEVPLSIRITHVGQRVLPAPFGEPILPEWFLHGTRVDLGQPVKPILPEFTTVTRVEHGSIVDILAGLKTDDSEANPGG